MPLTKTQNLNAVIGQKEVLTPRQIILRVLADGWGLPHFEAGQYTLLGLPPTAPRCRLSSPEPPTRTREDDYPAILDGVFLSHGRVHGLLRQPREQRGFDSQALRAQGRRPPLALGHHIVGAFTLREANPEHHIVLIATGTGLAPYMSMLTTHLDCGGARKVAVLHGAYHSWPSAIGMSSSHSSTYARTSSTCRLSTSRMKSPRRGTATPAEYRACWRKGVVRDAFGFMPAPDNTDVFICGNPKMTDEMESILLAEGFGTYSPTARPDTYRALLTQLEAMNEQARRECRRQ